MNTKQIHYIVTLAKEGTFSKAADVLKISQPSLSQYVKTIEKQLGVDLFDRVSGNLKLTDAGKTYLAYAKKMQSLERQLQSELLDIKEFKKGTLTVGTTPFRSISMMPRIVSEFRKLYHDIEVVIEEKGTTELLQMAQKGEFDLCLTTLPKEELVDVECDVIMEEEVLVAVSKDSLLHQKLQDHACVMINRKYPAVSCELLDQAEFVMLTEEQVMQRVLNRMCEEYDVQLRRVATVRSLEALLKMVKEQVGAALLPTGIEEDDASVVFYSLQEELPRRKVAVLYKQNQYLSKIMLDMIQVMKDIKW